LAKRINHQSLINFQFSSALFDFFHSFPRLRPLRRLRRFFLMGAATPPLPRSIQSCPAGQLHNRKEVGGTKTKNLSAYFLERGVFASKTRANVQTPDPSFARMEYVLVQHSSHTQGNVFPLSRRFD